MNCARVRELLHFYLDGSLEAGERQDVEAHVTGCAPCRGEVVRIERVMLAVESLPRLLAPPNLLARTMAVVERAAGRERGDNRSGRWAANSFGPVAMMAGLVLAAASADEAVSALSSLMLEQENPIALLDGLFGVAASLELPLVAGLGLLLGAGCVTLAQLFAPGPEARVS